MGHAQITLLEGGTGGWPTKLRKKRHSAEHPIKGGGTILLDTPSLPRPADGGGGGGEERFTQHVPRKTNERKREEKTIMLIPKGD